MGKKVGGKIKEIYIKFGLKNKLQAAMELMKKHYILCLLWFVLIITNIVINHEMRCEMILLPLALEVLLIVITKTRQRSEKARKLDVYKELINTDNMYTYYEESKQRVFFAKKLYTIINIVKMSKLRAFVAIIWFIDTFKNISEEIIPSVLDGNFGSAIWQLIDDIVVTMNDFVKNDVDMFQNVSFIAILSIIVFFMILSYRVICILFEGILLVLNMQPWTSNYESVLADHAYVKCYIDKEEEKIKDSINI